MVRGMKYHIYETKEGVNPLCWDDKALEFDTIESACRFLCDLLILTRKKFIKMLLLNTIYFIS